MNLKRSMTALLTLAALLLALPAGCGSTAGGEREARTANAPSAARDDFRAVWVATVYNLDYPNAATTDADALKAQADEILENCVDMGMNAVILQVRPSGDALYPSELFPWSKYLTGASGLVPEDNFDPLAYWVERAHELGLELHAWINPFRITKGGEAELAALDAKSPAVQHPEWVVECDGNYYLNPGLPEVRELVIQGAEELVRNYDVDGVHLDDYFYPSRSFNDEDTFQQYGGAFSSIGDWRRDNVNQLIQGLDERLHALDPELSFGVSPSGVWADSTHQSDGSATTGNYESYYAAYADSRKWVKEGWVDYICPQIYWYIGHPTMDYETIARWWSDTVEGTGVKLYIGMADYLADDGTEGSPWNGLDAITEQLALNRELGVSGEAHFRYKFLAVNSNMKKLYETWYSQSMDDPLAAETAAFLSRLPQEEQTHWAAQYYGVLGAMGVVTGKPDGTFSPDEQVDRASMCKLAWGAMPYLNGKVLPSGGVDSPFPDTAGTWAEGYIGVLYGQGCLEREDYPDGFFPADPMPRAEVVKLLVRALGYEDDGSVTGTVYPDVTEDFYYIARATELGIITGKPDGTFAPGEGVDRGSAAAMLLRAMDAAKAA